jgi:putative ABC transport system permease protein
MPDAVGRFWRRALFLLNWRRNQAELREEIEQHHALKQAEFEAQGMSPADAASAASRAMGNMTVERETSRRVWSLQLLESVWHDTSYAVRSMLRDPVFTLVAVLGLAGGLGFSSAAFSAFNALALRGWEVPESERLVSLFATSLGDPGNRRMSSFSYDQMAMFDARARTLDGIFAFERTRSDGTGNLTAQGVSARYFSVLDVPIVRGRGFLADEDRVGVPTAVLVISDDWWRTRRNGATDVIGSVERVNGVPFTVIGVAAPGFRGTDLNAVDGWIPLTALPLVKPKDRLSRTSLARSDECCVQMAARLSDGSSRKDAEAEITALLAQTMRPGIDTVVRTATVNGFTVAGSSGPDVGKQLVPIFVLIFGGVGVVLLLACANVANLLLARAATRERELSIRLALGASRARLVRQLMTESLVLALLAGVPALMIARWLPGVIMNVFTNDTITLSFAPDARVLAVTVGLAVASCLLFGVLPAFHATRPLTAQRNRLPLRAVFLSAQVTFCVVLLVAAGLFVRSAGAGRALDLGYSHGGVTEVMLTFPANEDEVARAQRLQVELPELASQASVREVAFSEFAPFAVGSSRVQVGETERRANTVRATPEYFTLLQLTMLAGRAFGVGNAARDEIVINALVAESFGGVGAAVGKTIVVDSAPRTIVGVVRTARDNGDLRNEQWAIYRPYQWNTAPRVLVRGSVGDAQRLAELVRARDASVGATVRPYQWYIENSLSSASGAAAMAGSLGLLALLLAAVGIFGVFSFWVRQRQRDIGIRLALGASRGRILRMVVGATGRAIGWGLALGVLLSTLVGIMLRSSLYGLSPFDPVSFGAAVGVLLVVAFLATLLPAWRAVHVDPVESLRSD